MVFAGRRDNGGQGGCTGAARRMRLVCGGCAGSGMCRVHVGWVWLGAGGGWQVACWPVWERLKLAVAVVPPGPVCTPSRSASWWITHRPWPSSLGQGASWRGVVVPGPVLVAGAAAGVCSSVTWQCSALQTGSATNPEPNARQARCHRCGARAGRPGWRGRLRPPAADTRTRRRTPAPGPGRRWRWAGGRRLGAAAGNQGS